MRYELHDWVVRSYFGLIWDKAYHWRSRFCCRVFGHHNPVCWGREDHR